MPLRESKKKCHNFFRSSNLQTPGQSMLVTTQPRMTDKSIQPIHHPHSCLSFLSFYVPVKLFCISFSALFLSKLLCIIILEHSRILSCLPIPISTILSYQ
uniref:Uncharacterized protein n=1 Tax=Cacopsylla melanoneura TaxID=428564 RepID=A0A8D8YXQ2_9HEMI